VAFHFERADAASVFGRFKNSGPLFARLMYPNTRVMVDPHDVDEKEAQQENNTDGGCSSS